MKKILFVLTSHDKLGDTGRSTGFYLSELSHPQHVFAEAGYIFDYVSPKGGAVSIDGKDAEDEVNAAFLANAENMKNIENTMSPDHIDASTYDAIFYVGGHGTMWDFPDNEALATIAANIYENGGVVGAVCHGPVGLVNIKLSDGSYLVDGKKINSFTNEEEHAVELQDVVPFLLESKLIERGAIFEKSGNFEPHVASDQRVVTGQNPMSATGVAEEMVRVLEA